MRYIENFSYRQKTQRRKDISRFTEYRDKGEHRFSRVAIKGTLATSYTSERRGKKREEERNETNEDKEWTCVCNSYVYNGQCREHMTTQKKN